MTPAPALPRVSDNMPSKALKGQLAKESGLWTRRPPP